jgi:tol-pal system protein YbgF
MKQLQTFVAITLLLLPFSTAVVAQTMEERVTQIERKLANQTMLDLLDQIAALQKELRELRGLTEEQFNEIESLKKRQRELYLDIDRRLSSVEREGPVTVSSNNDGKSLSKPADTLDVNPTTGDEQASPELLKEERDAYQAAFNQLRELRYEQAIDAFRGFMQKFPAGKYAHIAQYWLGEANYARREFKQAIKDYQTLINKFPNSPKLIESMLKIGYSYYEMKDYTEATKQLEDLLVKYPKTTEAGQAQQLINTMRSAENR